MEVGGVDPPWIPGNRNGWSLGCLTADSLSFSIIYRNQWMVRGWLVVANVPLVLQLQLFPL